MIARSWQATATTAGARDYVRHFDEVVLAKLATIDGFRGACVLLDESGENVRIEDLTFWDSLDSIRAFAGNNLETAVVDEVAQHMLITFDTTVNHRTAAQATW